MTLMFQILVWTDTGLGLVQDIITIDATNTSCMRIQDTMWQDQTYVLHNLAAGSCIKATRLLWRWKDRFHKCHKYCWTCMKEYSNIWAYLWPEELTKKWRLSHGVVGLDVQPASPRLRFQCIVMVIEYSTHWNIFRTEDQIFLSCTFLLLME